MDICFRNRTAHTKNTRRRKKTFEFNINWTRLRFCVTNRTLTRSYTVYTRCALSYDVRQYIIKRIENERRCLLVLKYVRAGRRRRREMCSYTLHYCCTARDYPEAVLFSVLQWNIIYHSNNSNNNNGSSILISRDGLTRLRLKLNYCRREHIRIEHCNIIETLMTDVLFTQDNNARFALAFFCRKATLVDQNK